MTVAVRFADDDVFAGTQFMGAEPECRLRRAFVGLVVSEIPIVTAMAQPAVRRCLVWLAAHRAVLFLFAPERRIEFAVGIERSTAASA
jgi:hypothetical protein